MRPETEMALLAHLKNQDKQMAALTAEIRMLRNIVEGKLKSQTFLTLDEAAEVLKVGKTTMYKRVTEGCYPWAVKQGRKWLFPYDRIREIC